MSAKCLGYYYGGAFIVLTVIALLAVGTAGGSPVKGDAIIEIGYNGCSLSIDVQEARVSEVFEELARRTPYEFIVPEELSEHRITLRCSGVELEEGIRRIITSAGVDNYALVYGFTEPAPGGRTQREIKVVLMGGASERKDEAFVSRRAEGASGRPREMYGPSMPHEKNLGLGLERGPQATSLQTNTTAVSGAVPDPVHKPLTADELSSLRPQGQEDVTTNLPQLRVIPPGSEELPVYKNFTIKEKPTKLDNVNPSP